MGLGRFRDGSGISWSGTICKQSAACCSPVWARGRCRISPPRFLAECCKRTLNHVSFVPLYFRLSTFSDLYWVCLSVFSCTVLFVSISQVIGCEDRLRNDLYCVGWGVKLYSNQPCSLLQTDNRTNISSLCFYRLDALPDAQPTVSKHWTTCNKCSWKDDAHKKIKSGARFTKYLTTILRLSYNRA